MMLGAYCSARRASDKQTPVEGITEKEKINSSILSTHKRTSLLMPFSIDWVIYRFVLYNNMIN